MHPKQSSVLARRCSSSTTTRPRVSRSPGCSSRLSLTVETFETAEAFLAACSPDQPGCLVLDLRLPGMSGVVLQEELRARRHHAAGHHDHRLSPTWRRPCACSSAAPSTSSRSRSPTTCCSSASARRSPSDAQQRRARAAREHLVARLACLTAREREVFDQVVHGKANKVVAIEFGISEKTVEAHRARVMQKLGADSLAELVRMDLAASQIEPWYAAARRRKAGGLRVERRRHRRRPEPHADARSPCTAMPLQPHQVGERLHFELRHHAGAMRLDGLLADAELVGDDLVGLAGDDHRHDLALAPGQPLDAGRAGAPKTLPAAALGIEREGGLDALRAAALRRPASR